MVVRWRGISSKDTVGLSERVWAGFVERVYKGGALGKENNYLSSLVGRCLEGYL